MFYKPRFCCNCGEKVERKDWRPWTSGRFCELCEADLKLRDWLPRIVVSIGLLGGIFGFGSYLQRGGEKPLNLTKNVPAVNPEATADAGTDTANTPRGFIASPSQNSNSANQSKDAADRKTLPVQLEGQQNPAEETVYFCGAKTKKGKPCTRLVKGGGRCWQHPGRPAMVPQDKLLAGT